MSKVTAELSMSLDGFIAHRDDSVDHLFDWYFNGEVEVPTVGPPWVFHTSEASARHVRGGLCEVWLPCHRAATFRLHRRLGRSAPHRRGCGGAHARKSSREVDC